MKIDRLLGILTILLQNERVTAPELAARFEVHRRTIGRDIDALCRAGIPLVTYQGAGGGISIVEGYKLDKSVLTRDELTGIIAALKGLDSVSGDSTIERTLTKLHADSDAVISLREPIIIDLASYYKGQLVPRIEQIKRAILDHKIIQFEYHYEKGESARAVEPYFLIFQWNAWYLFGFCLKRQDWRLFKLLRILNLETSDQPFEPREIPLERTRFIADSPDNTKLVALFEPSEKYRIIEAYGPDCCTQTNDGILVEITCTNQDYIMGWLLSFGDKVKVIEPSEVAQQIKDIARKVFERY